MEYKKQSNGNNDDTWGPGQVKEQGPNEYNQSIKNTMKDHLKKITEIDIENEEMEIE